MDFSLEMQKESKNLLKILKSYKNLQKFILKTDRDDLNNFRSDSESPKDFLENLKDISEKKIEFKDFNKDFNENQLETKQA